MHDVAVAVRWRYLGFVLWLLMVTVGPVGAQESPPTTENPPAAESSATATPAEAAATATLPPYMSPTVEGEKPSWPDAGGSNAGSWTTPSATPGDDDPSNLTNAQLYDRITHNLFSINIVWVLLAGCLVMFMQFGFMMVETGLCRAKNAAHTSAMNFMIYPLGCLAFWAYGFAIGWGNWWNAPVPPGWYSPIGPGTVVLNEGYSIATGTATYGLFGTKGFFLYGMDDVSVMALFFFMMVFMDTTATIPTGTLAERWSWKNFVLFGLWVALPYCLYANWVWGGGWLAQSGLNWGLGHGAVDFAGSGVVHSMGGIIALAGALIAGPRLGRYVRGKTHAMPGHNIPMVIAGTFVLAFGWFGFNAGSSLAGTDLRISTVVVNTMLASVAGAFFCMLYLMARGMKADPSMMCNGMLAGLVAITRPCAFVDSWAAVVIGGIAGVLVVLSVFFWDRMQVDDPVGAISVHGVNGIWGVISLGLFANGKYGGGWNGVVREEMVKLYGNDGVRGLLYGDSSQLMAQLTSAATVIVFGFGTSYALFKLSNLIAPIRVSEEDERSGLDLPEMGALGYPDFMLSPHSTHSDT